jgi:hypothetical protein
MLERLPDRAGRGEFGSESADEVRSRGRVGSPGGELIAYHYELVDDAT